MKRFLLTIAATAACAAVLTGCGGKKDEGAASTGKADASNKLVVWSFTDEIEGLINDYYKPAHPDVEVEYSFTPTDQFPNKLDPVLASGQGTPDVFGLENAFVRKYIESGLLLPLDDVYEEVKGKMADYPMKIGSYDGHVYGMAWQVCPGALFYRRSLAKQYLGTDDPAEVQKYVKDLDTFMSTAELLKNKSGGKCDIISTTDDMLMPYKGARKQPWVVNDKLVIDPAMDKYMDMCKTLHDKGYEGRVDQWSEGWYAGMKGTLKDEKGNPVEVFCYLLPTWGLHYVLKTNAPDTAGDWAMCEGPANYYWGGTWVAAYKGTKNPKAAKEMIKYIATDDTYLEAYAKKSGDTVGNLNVQNKIKDTFSEPYLGGQNHYAAFCEMAKGIDGSLIQGSDQQIEQLFSEAVKAYKNGEKSKDAALNDFKSQVASTLGY
ncbi:MAG: extracellular solute-binding protein [Treponema sp.]|nr:extracellular solute-binding protein [Treponema sp.]